MYAAEFEAQEEHDGAADDGEGAEPVDGLEAGEDGRLGRFDVEEEEEDCKGEAVARYCNVNSIRMVLNTGGCGRAYS